ncbi:GIY-YIG nuclease family protein [Patescibacteria group bacterium]|nr:GIY-YIG nuclease family protein [Patescibacteria group bacterium]MBU1868575.1 GIY-YIG nuclease family protein [Patescibacteria group bacterium]
MHYVYILQSLKNGSLYIGYTQDSQERLKAHNLGENISTKNGIPWKLVFYEAFLNKKDALSREKYLKSGWGRRSINRLLNNYLTTKPAQQ